MTTWPVARAATSHSMGRAPASSRVLKKMGAILPPNTTPPARLLGTWGISSPMCHKRELTADFREEPVPTTSPTKRLFNPGLAFLGGGTIAVFVWAAIGEYVPSLMASSIVREDGVIQYATAFLFLGSAGLSLRLSIKLPEKRRKYAHLILALGFLLCFGEEISWGQRIFNFSTPELTKLYNTQGEFNLHNSLGYSADHIFIAGVFIYGAIIPFLAIRNPFILRLFDLTGLPLASLGLSIGFVMTSLLHNWTVYSLLERTPLRIAETRELLSALGFLILMIETHRYLRHDKS